MKLLAALLLASAALFAQAQPETAAIEGRVLDSATGAGLTKATVSIERIPASRPAAGYWTRTENEGRFRLPDLEPGDYNLSVERAGYAPKKKLAITAKAGQAPAAVEVRMVRHSVIAGAVRDKDGKPLTGIGVIALQRHYLNGSPQLQPAAAIITDDRGQYRIYGLAAGIYYLAARTEAQPEAAPEKYVLTFYPAALEPANAQPLELAPGEVRPGVDFEMRKLPTHDVRGTLVNRAGIDMESGAVFLVSPLGDHGAPVYPGTSGFGLVGITPGRYELAAAVIGGGAAHVTHRPIEIKPDTTDLTVVAYQAADVPGEVSSQGLVGVSVKLIPQTGLANAPAYGFQSRGSSPTTIAFGPTSRTAVVDADGRFLLTNVQPDRYRVTALGLSADRYLNAVMLGGRDVLPSGIDYSEGASGSLRLVLRDDAGQVSGKLTDDAGRAISRATIVMAPEDPALHAIPDRYGAAHTGNDGEYTVGSLMPGSYQALVWEQIDDGDWMDPDLRKPLEETAPAITVAPHSRQTLDLSLPHR